MNKLSAIDLLGSHTFDHYKTSHGWKEKENKWGIKKYITDEGMYIYLHVLTHHMAICICDMYTYPHTNSLFS